MSDTSKNNILNHVDYINILGEISSFIGDAPNPKEAKLPNIVMRAELENGFDHFAKLLPVALYKSKTPVPFLEQFNRLQLLHHIIDMINYKEPNKTSNHEINDEAIFIPPDVIDSFDSAKDLLLRNDMYDNLEDNSSSYYYTNRKSVRNKGKPTNNYTYDTVSYKPDYSHKIMSIYKFIANDLFDNLGDYTLNVIGLVVSFILLNVLYNATELNKKYKHAFPTPPNMQLNYNFVKKCKTAIDLLKQLDPTISFAPIIALLDTDNIENLDEFKIALYKAHAEFVTNMYKTVKYTPVINNVEDYTKLPMSFKFYWYTCISTYTQ